jgi:hypothetical protein
VDQLDDAHTTSGSGQRRSRRGIGQIRFGTVLVLVPAVVQSHPASVAQAPRPSHPSPCVRRPAAAGVMRASVSCRSPQRTHLPRSALWTVADQLADVCRASVVIGQRHHGLRCRIEPYLDQGGACGAAGPASAPRAQPWRGPPGRTPGHTRQACRSRWLTRRAGRCCMGPSSSPPDYPARGHRV